MTCGERMSSNNCKSDQQKNVEEKIPNAVHDVIMISYHCLEIDSRREHDNDCDDAEENGERCCDDCANF